MIKPGDCEKGFSRTIGQFDCLLDTANDERPAFMFGDMRDLDDDDDSLDLGRVGGMLGLLESRHSCQRYVLTGKRRRCAISFRRPLQTHYHRLSFARYHTLFL